MFRSLALTLFVLSIAATDHSNVGADEEGPVLREMERFTTTMTIANPYDRAVKVGRLYSSCACFKLEVAEHFLLPWQETELVVVIDNRNRSGRQEQDIWLEFTDPNLERLEVTLRWRVIPAIAVDSLPPAGPFDRRPEALIRRDVYSYTSHARPDELANLQELILLTSPDDNRPEDGLQVTRVAYEGDLWQWTVKNQGPGMVLVVGQARDPDQTREPVKLEEALVLHTNHPRKPKVTLQILTALDYNTADPWANKR